MVKGRKPKPTALHEASGAYVKNPQRRKADEPQPMAGRPEIPGRIASDMVAKRAWSDICDQLADMNVLTKADVFVIEKLAMLESMIDLAWSDKDVAAFNKLITTWKGLLIECGLTPSARVRTKAIVKDDEDDPAEALLARMNGG